MTELGWSSNEHAQDDTGEDVAVKIFDPEPSGLASKPSGLNFYAQLKSTDDDGTHADALQLNYRLRTADLLDWEDSQPPVVIFVWNVTTRTGNWIFAIDAIAVLATNNADWRAQQTVTVHIPLLNTTDHNGLRKLRKRVADLVLPSVSKGRLLEGTLKVSFPPSPEGRRHADAFKDALDRGTPYDLGKQYLESFDLSPWFQRLYGDSLGEIANVQINATPKNMPLRLEFKVRHPESPEALVLDLLVKRLGRREAEITNEDDGAAPLWVTIIVKQDQPTELNFSINPLVRSPGGHVAAARLLQRAVAAPMTITAIGVGPDFELRVSAGKIAIHAALAKLLEAISLLARLEAFAEFRGTVHLDRVSDSDLSLLRALANACETGEAVKDGSVRLKAVSKRVLTDSDPIFRFDKTFGILGAGLHFQSAYVAPANRNFLRTAKKRRDGKVDIELKPFCFRFGEPDPALDDDGA